MGVRPDEKMYQDPHTLTETTVPAGREKIEALQGATVPWKRWSRN
jgi:hypothetical protein